ncbi:taste receptor type 2 member 40-like [Discoglossus pictus]
MYCGAQTAAFIVTIILSISGFIFNSFILTVSFRDQNGYFTLRPSGLIQGGMALTNVVLQCLFTVQANIAFISSHLFAHRQVGVTLVLLECFTINYSSWLTAWLCSFYCVTIVNFQHKVVTSLKMRLSGVVPKLLLVTALWSFSIGVPSIWYVQLQHQTTRNLTGACTTNGVLVREFNTLYTIVFTTLGCVLPLIITLTTIGFTLASLLGHVRRIRLNDSISSVPQLEAHYRACRTMILLVIHYVIFNMAEMSSVFLLMSRERVLDIITWLVILLYPTAQALIVISGSSRLTKALSCIGQA